MPDVLFEKRPDGVALIALNRPESLNALGGEIPTLLASILRECAEDRSIRCLALTGTGRGFCAGGDVKNMQRRNDAQAASEQNIITTVEGGARQLQGNMESISIALYEMPKPVVALVNGVAVGAGMSIALACDIRIASDTARFGTAFAKVGLSGDYGVSFFLPRLVGTARARELLFSAEILDAARALELGIVNRVVAADDLMVEGLAYCGRLASGPTAAFGRMKDNLGFAQTVTLREALGHEALNMRLSGYAPDSQEAVRAFVEKREPKFRGE